MEWITFIFSSGKDGAFAAIAAFSLVVNFVLCIVIRSLWQKITATQDKAIEAIANSTNVVQTNNTLIQLMLSGVKKR